MSTTRGRLDRYTLELQRHGLESVEREVRWLNELIATERAGVAARPRRRSRTEAASPSLATQTTAIEGEHL
jgi:hypothetical protein